MKYLSMALMYFLSLSIFAGQANIYFAKVERIDNNNVIHINHKDSPKTLRIAYLQLPVKNEFMHTELNQYLNNVLLNKWVRISELNYYSDEGVYSALIRDPNNKMINVQLASKGLGMPNSIENPPNAITQASLIAKNQKLGLWQNPQKFAQEKTKNTGNDTVSFLKKIMESMKIKQTKDHQIYVGDINRRTAIPMICAPVELILKKKLFTTSFSAAHAGYKIIECPKKNDKI
jgi:endonuclease YncB( thermonuclease family)